MEKDTIITTAQLQDTHQQRELQEQQQEHESLYPTYDQWKQQQDQKQREFQQRQNQHWDANITK